MIADELGEAHTKKIILSGNFSVDVQGCYFADAPKLNSEALSSVVFPNYANIYSDFGVNVNQGSRFHHPRLQLCRDITVHLKAGVDLIEWKNKFSCAVSPHLESIYLVMVNYTNPQFPLLKLSEKDAAAFTCPTLRLILSYFDEDHPITYLACQIAKLNNLKIYVRYNEKDP